jgi:hypothetical protein
MWASVLGNLVRLDTLVGVAAPQLPARARALARANVGVLWYRQEIAAIPSADKNIKGLKD